jgi:hypothetical protein
MSDNETNTDMYNSETKSIHAKEIETEIKQFINLLKKYKRKNGKKKRN